MMHGSIRGGCFVARLIQAISFCVFLTANLAAARTQTNPPQLTRGINVGDYLAYPQSTDWPIFRGPRAATSDDEFRRMAEAGFDFVRLAVEPSPFLDRSPAQIEAMEQRLVDVVRRITATGMRVMISGWARHESTTRWRAGQILATRESADLKAYVAFLKRIIVLLRDVPSDQWVLEPFNEPQVVCKRTDGPDWTVVQRDIYLQIREIAPNLTVVLTPGCWSKIEALTHFEMAGYDARTLIDVHYYEPYAFTHQSATWGADWIKYMAGLSFPPELTDRQAATDASARLFAARTGSGSAAAGAAVFADTLRKIDVYMKENSGPRRIARDFDVLKAWAERHKVPPARIIIGEFGAYRSPSSAKATDDGSRMRWLETVRTAAASRGYGWAMYAYHSDFGLVVDEKTAAWDHATLTALGLKTPGR
jgi:endoglucanase